MVHTSSRAVWTNASSYGMQTRLLPNGRWMDIRAEYSVWRGRSMTCSWHRAAVTRRSGYGGWKTGCAPTSWTDTVTMFKRCAGLRLATRLHSVQMTWHLCCKRMMAGLIWTVKGVIAHVVLLWTKGIVRRYKTWHGLTILSLCQWVRISQ